MVKYGFTVLLYTKLEVIVENRVRTVNLLSSPIHCIFRIQWIGEDSGIKTERYQTSANLLNIVLNNPVVLNF